MESSSSLNYPASDAVWHFDKVLAITDAVAFWLALILSHLTLSLFAPGNFIDNWYDLWDWYSDPHLYVFFLLTLLSVLWFGAVQEHYTFTVPLWHELQQVWCTVLLFAVINLALDSIFRIEAGFLWWLATWSALMFSIPLLRYLCKRTLLRKGLLCKPTVIIGDGPNACATEEAFSNEIMLGCCVAGFIAPNGFPDLFSKKIMPGARDRSYQLQIDLREAKVVLALESSQEKLIDGWIRSLLLAGVLDLSIVSPVRGVPLYGSDSHYFLSHEILMLRIRNNIARPAQRKMKRAFDVSSAVFIALLLSPLLLGIWWCIHKDGGDAIFGHERVGQGGRRFKCYKFRTMVPDAKTRLEQLLATSEAAREEWARGFKLKEDPRVTKIGGFLRKTSMDELPQLWNVIKGDMSLVGPRPIVEAELERYGENVAYYQMTKPGITGVWQTSGRTDVDYPTRVCLDVWYLKNWSFWYDLVILLKTCSVVLKKNGAY